MKQIQEEAVRTCLPTGSFFPAGAGRCIGHAIICYHISADRSGGRAAGGTEAGRGFPADRDKRRHPL